MKVGLGQGRVVVVVVGVPAGLKHPEEGCGGERCVINTIGNALI